MKLVAAIAASLIAGSAFAQNAVETETVTAGLLGKRYVDTGLGWVDINHSSVEGMSFGLDVNVPVNTNFDVSLGYGYSWLEGAVEIGHRADVAVTGYITRGENKPFATLSTGYTWGNAGNGVGDYGVWGVEVGVERAVTEKLSSTLSAGYSDDYGQHRDSLWNVTLGGTYNITASVVAQAAVSYLERGSVGYVLGVAYRF